MAVSTNEEISLISSFALVCSASIGTGVLILSYGVMQAGLALGSLFMVLASICGSLTESIIIVSALKLNAKSLTSLIARAVAYSVIRKKRQIMKKRRAHSKAEEGKGSFIIDSNSDSSIIKKNFGRKVVGSRKKLGKSVVEEDQAALLDSSSEKSNQGHANWNEVSDLESTVSDLDCVRNVLLNNSLLFDDFRQELKKKLMLHSRVLNILVIITIGYCIPTYFILFTDYVEELFVQLIHTLSISFADSSSVLGIISFMDSINNKVALNFLCFILVFYTSYQPDISKIAKLGFLSLFSFIIFLFAVLYRYFIYPFEGVMGTPAENYEIGPHMGILQAFKVFNYAIYCFYSHLICIQAVTSVKNITYKKGIFIAMGTTALMLFICLSLSTVLNFSFGTALLPNPTLNYSPLDSVIALARFVSALTMLVVIPMHVIPFIDSIFNIYFLDRFAEDMVEEVEEAMIICDKNQEKNKNRHSQHSVSSYFTLFDDGFKSKNNKHEKEQVNSCRKGNSSIKSNFTGKLFRSIYFRIVATLIFLLFCILFALLAKNAAQYIELFAGFIDTFIIIVYPLYIYISLWRHKMPLFANIIIIGYLVFYEICALIAGIYTVYEHVFHIH
ncbi:uncharacterized protein cubi_03617 [Cryptosporidium ubiquitum]|uniref:Amino acid transporter transmembrane domain-containing protein n=1 Tax=Cryptosporidium ubiquitum TaxID=857276 RepID=A0A1J4MLB9_9CRYT|nr:uncharacterized protein cubi_03617 [Cryptosporidium ubiquitum]OII73820.1 hypothetical protein cubi_03617 [Cryptosporidium ubiquitum]